MPPGCSRRMALGCRRDSTQSTVAGRPTDADETKEGDFSLRKPGVGAGAGHVHRVDRLQVHFRSVSKGMGESTVLYCTVLYCTVLHCTVPAAVEQNVGRRAESGRREAEEVGRPVPSPPVPSASALAFLSPGGSPFHRRFRVRAGCRPEALGAALESSTSSHAPHSRVEGPPLPTPAPRAPLECALRLTLCCQSIRFESIRLNSILFYCIARRSSARADCRFDSSRVASRRVASLPNACFQRCRE